jgi:hypothetical protein
MSNSQKHKLKKYILREWVRGALVKEHTSIRPKNKFKRSIRQYDYIE